MPKRHDPDAGAVELLDKTATLELLDIGRRTLERYVRTGKIRPAAWDRPPRGGKRSPLFNRADVERLAAELAEPPAPIPAEATTATAAPGALAPLGVELLRELLDMRRTETAGAAAVPLTARLALTLSEAAELSGLGIGALEAAVEDGRLRAIRAGHRGARVVSRAAVEQLVSELFTEKPSRPPRRRGAR